MRLSVTDLDQLAYYRNSEMPLEDLLERLTRRTPPTPEMESGTALHTLLEHAQAGDEIDEVVVGGYRIRVACEAALALPPVRELKGTRELVVDGEPVTLVGKVDGIAGFRIWDHKTAARCDLERYAASIQWRAYLVMFGATRFTYNVFTRKLEGDVVTITGVESFDFYAYPGLEDDVRNAVADFVALARRHLPERLEAA